MYYQLLVVVIVMIPLFVGLSVNVLGLEDTKYTYDLGDCKLLKTSVECNDDIIKYNATQYDGKHLVIDLDVLQDSSSDAINRVNRDDTGNEESWITTGCGSGYGYKLSDGSPICRPLDGSERPDDLVTCQALGCPGNPPASPGNVVPGEDVATSVIDDSDIVEEPENEDNNTEEMPPVSNNDEELMEEEEIEEATDEEQNNEDTQE